MNNYGKFSLNKLKLELQKRGARTQGRKEVLIQRLEYYDQNENFRAPAVIMEDTIPIEKWPESGFKSLSSQHKSQLPNITNDIIKAYFISRLSTDNMDVSDAASLKKGRALLKSSFISACSVNVEDEAFVFFSGLTNAAMKKKVSYNFQIRLSRTTGVILNSNCECPAGKGPHGTCKHVAAVLYMLVDFVATGKASVTLSCTEKLQTFHKPKKGHSGSPMKAESMGARKRKDVLKDPRPLKFRNRD
ncbi:unnamed protein product, partial [Owenia fusiformis]